MLKVTRGVSEVISTIMLNAIATFLVAYFLLQGGAARRGQQRGQHQADPRVVAGPRHLVDGIIATPNQVYGFIVLAILVGLPYWFVLGKTRFGFDLRDDRAVRDGRRRERRQGQADGPHLDGHLRCSRRPGRDAAALRPGLHLRRHVPVRPRVRRHRHRAARPQQRVGIIFAALLWAYLDAQGNGLQINAGVSDRLVLVIQGVIVLSVVIAYELVRRAGVRMEQRRVASQLAAARTPSPETEGAAA